MTTWNDILTMAGRDRFAGRQQELLLFRQHITQTPPRYLAYVVSGREGVGKTALQQQYRQIAASGGWLLADCTAEESVRYAEGGEVAAHIMGRLAQALAGQGYPLKPFERRYKHYCQLLATIARDPEAPHGMEAMLGQVLMRDVYQALESQPEARQLLAALQVAPQGGSTTAATATWSDEWTHYLQQKFSSKDDMALLRDPLALLTPLFLQDLNKVAQRQPVLLCFDHIEPIAGAVQAWLAHLPDHQPSTNIRVLLATSQPPAEAWRPLHPVTLLVRLEGLSSLEAEQLLDMYGVRDAERRHDIRETSEGLPLLLTWQAAVGTQRTAGWAPSRDVVATFLQHLERENPPMRRVALLAAIPHYFDEAVLHLLLSEEQAAISASDALAWLQTLPFVQEHPQGWCYHPLVRRLIQRYQYQARSADYYEAHGRVATFYEQQRQRFANLSESERWASEEWCRATLAYIYHGLIASPRTYWSGVLGLLAQALWQRLTFAAAIADLLNQDDLREELPRAQITTVRVFHRHLTTLMTGNSTSNASEAAAKPLHTSISEIFDELRDITEMPPAIRGYLFNARGVAALASGSAEQAAADFTAALERDSHNTAALLLRGIAALALQRYDAALADFTQVARVQDGTLFLAPATLRLFATLLRGEVLLKQKHYEEARSAFDDAASMDGSNALVFARRGEAHRQLDDTRQAMADFSRALSLNPSDAWAFARRGDLHRQMGAYDLALEDLERAIALNPSDAWAFASRGETYRRKEQYKRALTDFARAIALLPDDAWTLASRGETYRQMGKHAEALKDFNRAIELDPSDPWPIASRGEVYRAMGELDSAVANYNWAIELDDQDIWTMVSRGEVHHELGRYELALFDFDRVIALDPTCTPALLRRSETYYAQKRYEAALADLDTIIAAYDRAGTPPRAAIVCRRGELHLMMAHHERALTDFNRAIALDTQNAHALAQRGLVRLNMQQYETALQDFNRASEMDTAIAQGKVAIAPTTTTLPALRGEAQRLAGRYDAALTDLTRALAAHTQDRWAFARRGAVLRLLGRYDEALADLSQALALNNRDMWALAGRGETYRLLGQYEEALVDFGRAIDRYDRDIWTIAHRGETYRLLGQYEEALTDFNHALNLDGQYAWALAHRGETHRQMGNGQAALDDFNQALALNNRDAWALAQRSETHDQMGQQRAALGDLDAAIKAAPEDDWLIYLRARHHLKTGNTSAFQRDLQRATEMAQARSDASQQPRSPDEMITGLNLALYSLAGEQVQQAEMHYQAVLAVCHVVPLLQAALHDLQDFRAVQPSSAAAPVEWLQQRIQALQAEKGSVAV